MIRILAGLVVIGTLSTWPAQAEAAEGHDSCTGFIDSLPATITTQGTWCLGNNLSTSMASGNAIKIGANNVTIDCNGFKIGGLAAGPGTEAIGIRVSYRLNATIRNCTIRGFNRGIVLSGSGGGGHLIEDNAIDESRTSGISISNAPGSIIRNNIVANTGVSTNTGPDGPWLLAIHGTGNALDIIDNTVNGVVTSGGGETTLRVVGIAIEGGAGGVIAGNRVRGLETVGGSYNSIFGILAVGSVAVFKNIVQNAAGGNQYELGIACGDSSASAHENVILGFKSGVDDYCFSGTNHTNPN